MRLPIRSVTLTSAALLFAAALFAVPGLAFGFQEPNTLPGVPNPAGCLDCHFDYLDYVDDCTSCHASSDVDSVPGFEYYEPWGPHSGYMTTTTKCRTCHDVHQAWDTGVLLLRSETVHDNCFTCHDGTGGWGVYGTLSQRGVAVGGGHDYDITNVVPGGDALTGGDTTMAFNGAGGTLTCTDCHAVHGANVVAGFTGDRMRMRQAVPTYTSSKLLRQRPTGAATPVTQYGSDWCLGCHQGRESGALVHNHPVDSAGTVVSPFTYANVARLISSDPTGVTELGPLGGLTTRGDSHAGYDPQIGADNRGFLMPYPRTIGASGQAGHAPICQQCHEDSRQVGTLVGAGDTADATSIRVDYADSVTWNGTAWVTSAADNPRFQNFPHETENVRMVVEEDDDLCLNCHPVGD